MATNNNFGIDLLFESQKNNIKTSTDVLMILAHWNITKNGYRCVGIGDNKIFDKEDRQSELLPEDWNINPDVYKIRYALKEIIYILYGVTSKDDDLLILNFLNSKTLVVSSVVLKVDKLVKSKTGSSLEDFMNESQEVIDKLQEKLINAIGNEEKSGGPSARPRQPINLPSCPTHPPTNYLPMRNPDPLRDIGRGDLDPFGRGGGMLFNPAMGPRVPMPDPDFHGRIPPGARFDPIFPNNRHDLNPDHMRPPDGYDDMFM